MAKMFYTLEEAAQKLGKSESDLKELVESGQLSEFRDGDRLVFKVEQVDLLAGDEAEESIGGDDVLGLSDSGGTGFELSLEDSSPGDAGSPGGSHAAGGTNGGSSEFAIEDSGEYSLASDSGVGGSAAFAADGGSGIDLDDSTNAAAPSPAAGESGISIFDAEEEGSTADASADTMVTEHGIGSDVTFDAGASGSGLLDLTREADDTSLGADFLDDVYSGDESTAGAAFEGGEGFGEGGGDLFESTGAPSDVSPQAAPGVSAAHMIPAEPYSGGWSGITMGVSIGMLVLSAFVLAMLVFGIVGNKTNPLLGLFDDVMMIAVPVGGAAGIMLIFGIIFGMIGKRG